MAQNEVTSTGTVLWESGDDITETALATAQALTTTSDYKDRGLSVTYDSNADTIDIGSGLAIPADGSEAYLVETNQETDISIPDPAGVNYVYLAYDPAGADEEYTIHVDDDDSAPSGPTLKLAEVDAANNSVDNSINDAPVGQAGIQTDAVGNNELQTDAVGNNELQTDAVGSNEIAAGAVGTSELAQDAAGSNEIQTDAVTDDELDLPSVVVETPDQLPLTELADGDSVELTIVVDDQEALEVYRWGAYDASDGSTPSGLDVELLDGSDTVQASANSQDSADKTSPVASHQNGSGSTSIFKLRAKNGTGSAIDSPGVGAHFGFVVV